MVYLSNGSKAKETHKFMFSWLSWLVVMLVGMYAQDDDDGATQNGGHT